MSVSTVNLSYENLKSLPGYDFAAIRAAHPLVPFLQARGVELLRDGPRLVALCPFHGEKTPSFTVWPDQHKWFCFGCRSGGDVVDAAAALDGINIAEATRRLAERSPEARPGPIAIPKKRTPQRRKPTLPPLRVPTANELDRLMRRRSIALEALGIAVKRGFLWVYNDWREGPAWAITDRERWLAIGRRLDGKPWQNYPRRPKSINIPSSWGSWPVGIREAQAYPAIALVEGGPDFLAAIAHAWADGLEDTIAPVCMGGASLYIPAEVLPCFAGKAVRIFADDDGRGYEGAARWYDQLKPIAAYVDVFGFEGLKRYDGKPVKDLNDLLAIDESSWETHQDVIESVMDFCAKGAK